MLGHEAKYPKSQWHEDHSSLLCRPCVRVSGGCCDVPHRGQGPGPLCACSMVQTQQIISTTQAFKIKVVLLQNFKTVL